LTPITEDSVKDVLILDMDESYKAIRKDASDYFWPIAAVCFRPKADIGTLEETK
jgi:hypothetical protein